MERLEYTAYGGPEVVHLSPFTLPKPAADEIIVRVAASSINPLDWKLRSGVMKIATGSKFPRAMGQISQEQLNRSVLRYRSSSPAIQY